MDVNAITGSNAVVKIVTLDTQRAGMQSLTLTSVLTTGYSSGHTLPVMFVSEVLFPLDLVDLVYNNNRN